MELAAKISECGSADVEETTNNVASSSSGNHLIDSSSFSEHPTLEELRQMQAEFCEERNWDQYHKPRNLLLALVGEVGEVSELFQWRGEVEVGLPDWSSEEKEDLAEELSDVLLYLIRLASKCRIDLPKAALHKMAQNRLKYPAQEVYGSSKKYTKYNNK